MSKNFNDLTPAQTERLAILAEEMGEAIQVIGKILRHGYESRNPLDKDSVSNRTCLEREMGDVLTALWILEEAMDIDSDEIGSHAVVKRIKIKRWMHHQDDD